MTLVVNRQSYERDGSRRRNPDFRWFVRMFSSCELVLCCRLPSAAAAAIYEPLPIDALALVHPNSSLNFSFFFFFSAETF